MIFPTFGNVSFYLLRGRSAEDRRKIGGSIQRKNSGFIHESSHHKQNCHFSIWSHERVFSPAPLVVSLAPRKIRGRSAEDLRKTSAEDSSPTASPSGKCLFRVISMATFLQLQSYSLQAAGVQIFLLSPCWPPTGQAAGVNPQLASSRQQASRLTS